MSRRKSTPRERKGKLTLHLVKDLARSSDEVLRKIEIESEIAILKKAIQLLLKRIKTLEAKRGK